MAKRRQYNTRRGFPDSYRIEALVDGVPLSKKAQVRMVGNSVCPPLAAAIARAQFEEQALEVVA